MKKKGLISFVMAMLICGCSCTKVNETTYNNAISNYNASDAISFTRIEKVENNEDSSDYTKTTVNADIVFDTNRTGEVKEMKYTIDYATREHVTSTITYYYSDIEQTLYRHKKVTGSTDTKTKQSMNFQDYFNVHDCTTRECLVAIPTNIAPVLDIEDVNGFLIEEVDGEAIATYTALCPLYENCQGNETIDYKLIIGGNGDVAGLSYVITGETTTTTVSYSFNNFGSHNVKIAFPNELENYIEGIID